MSAKTKNARRMWALPKWPKAPWFIVRRTKTLRGFPPDNRIPVAVLDLRPKSIDALVERMALGIHSKDGLESAAFKLLHDQYVKEARAALEAVVGKLPA